MYQKMALKTGFVRHEVEEGFFERERRQKVSKSDQDDKGISTWLLDDTFALNIFTVCIKKQWLLDFCCCCWGEFSLTQEWESEG